MGKKAIEFELLGFHQELLKELEELEKMIKEKSRIFELDKILKQTKQEIKNEL